MKKILAMSAIMLAMLAAPAFAKDGPTWNRNLHNQGNHGHKWNRGHHHARPVVVNRYVPVRYARPVYYYPQPVYYETVYYQPVYPAPAYGYSSYSFFFR